MAPATAPFLEAEGGQARLVAGRDWASGDPVLVEVADGYVKRAAKDTGLVESGGTWPWLCPGLFDLQVNGFGGFDLNAEDVSAATVAGMVRELWKTGVPLCLPTVITGSFQRISRAVRAVAEACRQDPLVGEAVVGIHLEGPYISPEDGPRGAHPREHVRPPDWEEFSAWQREAEGRIRLVTLSPEWGGAPAFIGQAVAAGVVVAIGHTAANGEQIAAAVEAGARLSTHLGNAAHAMLPRHPNYLWDQLANDRLSISLIADGHHLPPSVVKCFHRVKGTSRTILISDAVAPAGLPPGRYRSLGQEVELTPDGRIQLPGTPYLAGSALKLVDAVANMQRFTGAGFREAVEMASEVPARLLGVAGRLGRLQPGAPATFSLLLEGPGGRLEPAATILKGQVVWQK